jgi:hypothetical protein
LPVEYIFPTDETSSRIVLSSTKTIPIGVSHKYQQQPKAAMMTGILKDAKWFQGFI